jgi:hypothetical protein
MLTGEATPYALFHPLAARRLREIAPEAKLIVLLRDPVNRAYSHYLLERTRGDEPLEFSAALDAEPRRLQDEEPRLCREPAYRSEAHKHFSYTARGIYAPQLERWFESFPREQFLLVRSEDLYQRTAGTYAEVTGFLGIDPELRARLRSTIRRRDLLSTQRSEIAYPTSFAPWNARLPDLLGWDPDWS